MSRLLQASGNATLGASQNLKRKFIGVRNQREGGSFQPGQWEQQEWTCSPVSGLSPGNLTTAEIVFPSSGVPKRVEKFVLRFTLRNSGTDVGEVVNPYNLISSVRLHLNGHDVHKWANPLEFKLLYSEGLQELANDDEIFHRLAHIRQDAGTDPVLAREEFPNGDTTVDLDLFALWPQLDNLIMSAPGQKIRRVKMEIVFTPATGSAEIDGLVMNNQTNNAPILGPAITYHNVRLVTWSTEVVNTALLATPAPFFPFLKFDSRTDIVDWSAASITAGTATKTWKIGDALPGRQLVRKTYVLAENIGANAAAHLGTAQFNDQNNGGHMYWGPEHISLRFKKVGAITEMDLTSLRDARSWTYLQHQQATGKSLPRVLLDGSAGQTLDTLQSSYYFLAAIDWNTLENDSSTHDLTVVPITGIDTRSGMRDYEITVAPRAAYAGTQVRLWLINQYIDLYTLDGAGEVRRFVPE